MYLKEKTIRDNRDRFLHLVHMGGDDECWTTHGPTFMIDGCNTIQVGRFAWALFRGSLEPWQIVKHTCKNNCCVNPAHMTLREYPGMKNHYERNMARIKMPKEERIHRVALAVRLLKSCDFHPHYDVANETIALVFIPPQRIKMFYGTWKHSGRAGSADRGAE